MTVSQATSGEVAVLLTDNCVAPTAVTYGQVAAYLLDTDREDAARDIAHLERVD